MAVIISLVHIHVLNVSSQLRLQVFYFNRSLRHESMEQIWRFSTAAVSGSSCMYSNLCSQFRVVKLTGLTCLSQGRGPLQVCLAEGMCVTPAWHCFQRDLVIGYIPVLQFSHISIIACFNPRKKSLHWSVERQIVLAPVTVDSNFPALVLTC